MELKQYFNALLKWWWLIVAAVVIASVSSYLGTRDTPRLYNSRTTLMVGQTLSSPNPGYEELYTPQVLAQSYADLARREPVLQGALDTLGLQWPWQSLQGMVSSQVVVNTQLLQISVIDTDPERARVLADEVAQQLIKQSPTASDPQKDAEREFALAQIADLKTNIQNAQDEIRALDQVIATANSARQIQDARSRQQTLQIQVSTWQATYAQLLTGLQQGTPNYLSIVERAQTGSPVGTGTASTVLMAAAIGLVLSAGAALLLEYLDDTVKTPDDVKRACGDLSTLGGIARMGAGSRLITVAHPRSPVSEAYRVLRTGLDFTSIDVPRQTLLVTSAGAGEGKTTTAANLAVVMAQAGRRVLLIDADLRRPMLHKYFEVQNFSGMTNSLLQIDLSAGAEKTRALLQSAIQPTSVDGLQVLTSGPIPPNPAELVGSAKMKAALAAIVPCYDLVILDSPPVLLVADAIVLGTQVESVLLVIDTGRTRQGALKHAVDRLHKAGARVVGVALNRLAGRGDGYYYYYYYHDQYYYSSRDKTGEEAGKGRHGSNGAGGSNGTGNGTGNGAGLREGLRRVMGRGNGQ